MYEKYETWYRKINTGLRKQPGFVHSILFLNKMITILFYGLYPVLLLWEYFHKDERLMASVVIPAVSFILVSLARKAIGRTRPFVSSEMDPLIPKENKKDSMPSRHMFSATIITMVVGSFFPVAGIVLFLLCLLLGGARILTGVHYPSDILVGMLAGILGGGVYLLAVSCFLS